jgi:hypothetical protein
MMAVVDQTQSLVNKIKEFVTWYINYCISGHYPSSCFHLKCDVSETGYLSLQVEPTQLGQIKELVPISGHQHQHKIGYINQA